MTDTVNNTAPAESFADAVGATPAPAVFDPKAHNMEHVALEVADYVEQGKATKATKGATKTANAIMVERDKLVVAPGFNVRAKTDDYQAHIERLAHSMHHDGWLASKPVDVFVNAEGQMVVLDGHSRLAAYDWGVKHLGLALEGGIPVVVSEGRSMGDMVAGLVTQNQGRPLAPIEVAVVCKRLSAWGWDNKKVADRLGLSTAYVKELLDLIQAPESLVKAVQDGIVSASTAVKAIKTRGAKKAAEAVAEVVQAKQEEAAKAPAKGPKKAVKVVDSDLGQSKAQVAVKKAAEAAAPKPSKAAEGTAASIVRAVFNDVGFQELSKEVQALITTYLKV